MDAQIFSQNAGIAEWVRCNMRYGTSEFITLHDLNNFSRLAKAGLLSSLFSGTGYSSVTVEEDIYHPTLIIGTKVYVERGNLSELHEAYEKGQKVVNRIVRKLRAIEQTAAIISAIKEG